MHDQDLLRLLQPPKHSSTNYLELRKEIGAKRARARSIISLHCHTVIVDPALPLGRQTQAVTVTSGFCFGKKSTASGSNFQAE